MCLLYYTWVVGLTPVKHISVKCNNVVLQAVSQMEEKLKKFIEGHRHMDEAQLESDGTACFVNHQVVELARNILEKSEEKLLTSQCFYELSENLEKLLQDVGSILHVITIMSVQQWCLLLSKNNNDMSCLISGSRKVTFVCGTSCPAY